MLRPNCRNSYYDQTPELPFVPLKAVLLDDNLFDQRRLERLIRDSGLILAVEMVSTLPEFVHQLDVEKYDLVLLDYYLPVGSGKDALMLVRDHDINGSCATIMVASDDALDVNAAEMRKACDDYINKDQLSTQKLRQTILETLSEKFFNHGTRHAPIQDPLLGGAESLAGEAQTINPEGSDAQKVCLAVSNDTQRHPIKTAQPSSISRNHLPQSGLSDQRNATSHVLKFGDRIPSHRN